QWRKSSVAERLRWDAGLRRDHRAPRTRVEQHTMMDRRQFTGTMAGAVAGAVVSRTSFALHGDVNDAPTINAARLNTHLKELSAFGANPQGGVSRVAYSDFDRAGRAYVMDLMRAANLDVQVDFAGNIFGRRAGTGVSLKPIVFGSHIDSVPEG